MLLLKGHLSPWKQQKWGKGADPSWCHFKVTVGQETRGADEFQGAPMSPVTLHLHNDPGKGVLPAQGAVWRSGASLLC